MRVFHVIALLRATLEDDTVEDTCLFLGRQASMLIGPRILYVDVNGVHATRTEGELRHVVYRCHLSVVGVESSAAAQQLAFEALAGYLPTVQCPLYLRVTQLEVLSALTAGVER